MQFKIQIPISVPKTNEHIIERQLSSQLTPEELISVDGVPRSKYCWLIELKQECLMVSHSPPTC